MTSAYNGKTILLILVYFLWSIATFSQQSDLWVKANELVYSNPAEAIKICEHMLTTAEGVGTKAKINLLLSKCYLVKGDFNSAATYVFESGSQVPESNIQDRAEIDLFKAKLLRHLYLDNQSKKFLQSAETELSQIDSKSLKDSLRCNIALERVGLKLNVGENGQASQLLETTQSSYHEFLDKHPEEKERLYIFKTKIYRNLAQNDSAFVYIDRIMSISSSESSNNLLEKAFVLNELGFLYLQKKDFKNSEEALFIALRYASIIENSPLLAKINRNLAMNYLASNQQSKHKVYNDEFLVLNAQVELMEQQAINNVYNLLNTENKSELSSRNKEWNLTIYIVMAGILLILISGGIVLIRNQWRKKRLKEIIRYLEISRSNYLKRKPAKKTVTKKIIIPEDTENALISKLKKFENSKKFLQKDMSLAVLSGQFETNTKYLSEIINKHYHDNFNTFINKLRIGFIIDKLKSDHNYMNYKISVLADESGFSSHSSFATVFKSIVGMSPGTFIDLLREERENSKMEKNT